MTKACFKNRFVAGHDPSASLRAGFPVVPWIAAQDNDCRCEPGLKGLCENSTRECAVGEEDQNLSQIQPHRGAAVMLAPGASPG
jgi:hypothetical protein